MITLSRLFVDFHLKTVTLLVMSEFTREVQGSCELKIMTTMQHCATTIADQNLARLLMGVHKTEKYDLFGYLKRNKHEMLTILRKHKHKNATISEFIKGICNFQYFERNDVLFLSMGGWIKRKEQLNLVRKCSTRNYVIILIAFKSHLKEFRFLMRNLIS